MNVYLFNNHKQCLIKKLIKLVECKLCLIDSDSESSLNRELLEYKLFNLKINLLVAKQNLYFRLNLLLIDY